MDREKGFELLYEEAFPLTARFMSRMGGNFEDAKDLFQDALIVFYEKAMADEIALRLSAKGYVLGIARHLWMRKFRNNPFTIPLDEMKKEISVPPDFYAAPDPRQHLHQFMEMAGRKCMDMLQGFYYRKMSMQDIATTFGFSSTRSATVQKFKCLEKVRQHVKSSAYEEVTAGN